MFSLFLTVHGKSEMFVFIVDVLFIQKRIVTVHGKSEMFVFIVDVLFIP